MQLIHSKIVIIAIIFAVFIYPGISAAETTSHSKIPDELIARQLKKHDPSLAASVEAVRYKLKRNQPLTLVDVRRREDFERLYIPGSINIPLYAVKTKSYLKSAPVVLVNEGFRYAELESECRRLAERGYNVSILDGGLPAWQRRGGQLVGDPFELDTMKSVSSPAFFRAKDYETTLVIDISSRRSAASARLIPYAQHIPVLEDSDGSMPELKRLINKNRPFQSIVIFNESGKQYQKAENFMSRIGVEAYRLNGGLTGYQKYLEGLLLSWKPQESRMKRVGNCRPCGEKKAEGSAGSEIILKE